jgi:acetyl-CoA carboxylase carboxyl transferase subunit beta
VNWINNVVRPKIRSLLTTKRELPENLWVKCPDTGAMVFYKDLEANQFVIPGSDFHMRMGAQQRLQHLFDNGQYEKVPVQDVPQDPLKFRDGKRYTDRLKASKSDTGLDDAVLIGEGLLEGQDVVVAAQDFRFRAGSLGMAAGEAVITGMLRAVERRTPFILFAASGGARMQEGIMSLMQMPRTTIAVQRLRDARLPYLVVLTDPTTGGVTASYAMLGDVHIAEPGALICFAGPRVIQQTIREQLPEGFQKAEYLLAHGMIDMVVHRHKLRETLARLCRLLSTNAATARQSKPIAAKSLDRGYLNGNSVDGKTIETLARASDVMEPEPLDDDERFESRDKTKPRPGSGPRG